MPRNYIRKTTRQNWDASAMLKALEAVQRGMAFKTASKQFKVPLMSLKRRAKGENKQALGAVKLLGSKRTVFTLEQECELVEHIKSMESRMYGLTTRDVLSLAYQLAEKNHLAHPFSNKTEKAGKDWLKGFRNRNPGVTLRTPESTSAARARAFNKPVVERFFSIYKEVINKHSYPPFRIFNVDETSICTVPTKNTKVFAQMGRKQVARVTSAERGETTTAVICTSAAGNFIPPMFIFRRVRMKMELMDGAPPGSVYCCNTSGWMNLEVFTQWFDHFLSHVKPSEDDPALLILDGHLSHTKNLHVIVKARENHTTILCLPPHCTHKLQPLDVGVMYPLSVYHNQALERWMNNNPGRVVTAFQITKIFAEAYLKAAVPLNSVNAFSKCGIYPFNPDVFTDADFIAAETTEMELDADTSSQTHTTPISCVSLYQPTSIVPERTISPSILVTQTDMVDESTNVLQLIETTPPSSLQAPSNLLPVSVTETPISTTSINSSQQVSAIEIDGPVAIPSTSFKEMTPGQIKPLPKIAGKRSNLKRKKDHTSLLTSTPYKKYLEEEKKKKDDIEMKRTLRKEKKNTKSVSKKSKGKGVGKTTNKRQYKDLINLSESSTEDDNTECLFCTQSFSKDNKGEGWIRCCVCQRWGHDKCAGVDSDDADEFTCDWCNSDRFPNTRKRLDI